MVNRNRVIPNLDKVNRLYHHGKAIILLSNKGLIHASEGYIDNLLNCVNNYTNSTK